jgi:agmatinase
MADDKSIDDGYDAGSVGDNPGDGAFTAQSLYEASNEPMYSGATSFLRRKYSRDLKGVDVAVLGVPFDLATTGRSGARLGPRAVREASSNLAWDYPQFWDFKPEEKLAIVDYGDVVFDPGVPLEFIGKVFDTVKTIIDQGPTTLTIGGDHFITYPVLKAHAEKHGPLSLLHFDAHSDTWADDGDRLDHGTMFYRAAKEGLINPATSVQVGLRTHNPETHGFNIINALDVNKLGAEGVAKLIKQKIGDTKTYLTFDVDCLDPSFAPGTGTPVVGGLSTRMALDIIRNVSGIDVVAMDIVEVAPSYDVSEITALAGATLAYHMLCLYAVNHASR